MYIIIFELERYTTNELTSQNYTLILHYLYTYYSVGAITKKAYYSFNVDMPLLAPRIDPKLYLANTWSWIVPSGDFAFVSCQN